MRTMVQNKCLCHTEESATLLFIYRYTVIEYGHFRLKFAGISRLMPSVH